MNLTERLISVLAIVVATFASACMAGCGGGASGSSSSPTTPPPPPAPLAITSASPLPRAVVGHAYSTKLQASGGTPPYAWTASAIGPGLNLSSDGTLSGTPTQPASLFFSLTVTDSKGTSASIATELDVLAALAFLTPPNLPDVNVALSARMQIIPVGGLPPYAITISSGTLPPGLSFSSQNGVALIQGIPTAPGGYSFTVQVTDSFAPPLTASQTFSINILNNLVLPSTTIPDAVVNLSYSEFIRPAGGTPPYHLAIGQFSSLPQGLQLDSSTGRVFGTPTPASVPFFDAFIVTITDSAPTPASISPLVTLNVQPPLSLLNTSLPDSAKNIFYFQTITGTGGRQPYSIRIVSGALPDGLSINLIDGFAFEFLGTPTNDGLFKFTAQISDSYETPNVIKQDFQIRISDPMTLAGPSSAQILYNQSYSATFPATGGFPPYTWSLAALPAGFSFDTTTGSLSGTPTSTSGSTNNFLVSVHDSSNPPLTANFNFFLQVFGKLFITTSSLPPIATSRNILLLPQAVGGAIPYQLSVTSGSLPPGVVIGNLVGGINMLTGSPTTAGSYTFALSVSDANSGPLHQGASQQFTWIVKDPGQMTRNDAIANATPLSNLGLIASISPASDPSSAGPDVDVYSMSAPPGSVVQLYANGNNDFVQPPNPSALNPVMELVDPTGARYQTCVSQTPFPGAVFNLPCINGLPNPSTGPQNISQPYFAFQVPGTGSTPVTFYVRISDFRGDARPDFIYTFSVFGVN